MLSIKLILEKEQVQPYCKKCKKIYTPGFYIYQGEDNGTPLATGLFEIQSQDVHVVHYSSKEEIDPAIFDGILRAGFHYADLQGISIGVIPHSFHQEYQHIFAQLNYPNTPHFQIDNFFSKYKNCQS